MHILIERAKVILEMNEVEANFDVLEETIYQDWDYEYLYDLEADGIEDSPKGTEMGIADLHFADWFKPFLNASLPVHPYCQDTGLGK